MGALLHRGSDIFAITLSMDQRGIEIDSANELMRECESCLLRLLISENKLNITAERRLDDL